MGKETFNAEKAIEAQKSYLKELAKKEQGDWMNESFSKGIGFAPENGICYCCHRQIYSNVKIRVRDWRDGKIKEIESKGISVERASTELTTGCPHCHRSFVD